MSQDNIPQDTPQESSNEQQYASLEEAVFGTNEGSLDDTSSAFTDGTQENTEAAPIGQPAQSTETTQPSEPSNDEKRFQYWQSRADKLQAENTKLKEGVVSAPQQQAQQQYQEPYQEQQATEDFPPPPEKPARPRVFNREEAFSDPNSESARYLDEVEDWRDNVNEYNTLRTQYQGAIMEEKLQGMETERVQDAQRQQYAQQQSQQAFEIRDHVKANYGMDDSEAVDFMHKMSNPKSLNIDNLVQLYRLQKGGAAKQQTTSAQPSDAFQQVQNAQQVPSPMGVMPSGNTNTDGRTAEDKIMDKMIGNFNSKNPWK
jgi:hypothetical protein